MCSFKNLHFVEMQDKLLLTTAIPYVVDKLYITRGGQIGEPQLLKDIKKTKKKRLIKNTI